MISSIKNLLDNPSSLTKKLNTITIESLLFSFSTQNNHVISIQIKNSKKK